jgi:Carboxypeptidase regulatory-like domain
MGIRVRLQRAVLRSALLMSLVVLTSNGSFAQVSTATLNGVVTDPQGAVVPNATLVLRNVDTSVESKTVSNGAGAYEILSITPGRYTLDASASGFSTKQIPPFTLTVSQVATINFGLAVGVGTTVVTVQGAAPLLQTSSANLGTAIGTQQVNDLPLNGRNFTELLILTPGVTSVNTSANATGVYAPVPIGATVVTPSVNGQPNRSDFFLTDSLPNEESQDTTYAVPPIIDAIQEFKIVSHPDDAEYGSVLGGVVNVVTKTGTNELHGSAWTYYRDAIFDARGYFQPLDVPKSPYHQNQFGASMGGPVSIPKLYNGRNKTFFFGAYQGFRYEKTSDTELLVPTAAQLAGDESTWPTQIYNPFSTTPNPAIPGQYIRQPFPGNQIPANLISPQMVAYAKFVFPAAGPVLNSAGDNAIDPTPLKQSQNQGELRVDESLGEKDSVWFRYSIMNSITSESGGLPTAPEIIPVPARNFGGSWVHAFSPSLVLQVQGGHESAAILFGTQFSAPTAAIFAQVGFAASFAGGFAQSPTTQPLVPAPGITGYSNAGDQFEGADKAGGTTDLSSVGGVLSKVVRTHSLKFGASEAWNYYNDINATPSLGFDAEQTGDTNPADTVNSGDPIASFILNVPDTAERRNEREVVGPGGVFSVFAQDSWKATTNLTLNYGLRYDIEITPPFGTAATVGQQGGIQTGNMDFSNGTYVLNHSAPPCSTTVLAPCIPGGPALPAHVVQGPIGKVLANNYNAGPRVGFAYSIANKTSVYGSFGVMYDEWAGVTQMAQNITGGWPGIGNEIVANQNQPSSTSPTPTVTAQNPFAASGGTSLSPAATPFNQVNSYFDRHLKSPYSEQWTLGTQQVLNSSTTMTLNYVGSTTKRMDVSGYYNTALTPGPGDPQSRNLYNYIVPSLYDRSVGSANYNALQFSLNKRYSSGVGFDVSYTWSKTMDAGTDGPDGDVAGGVPQDPYDVRAFGSYSRAGFDIPNILAVNTLFQIPVGTGKRFSTGNKLVDYFVGNWQINNIFSAHTGQPYSVTVSSDIANTGNAGDYETMNLVGNPNLRKRTPAEWFNTTAFQVPAGFTYGSAGRNLLRQADSWNLDSSVFRQFPLGESRSFQLRGEAFNILNNTVFGTPASDFNDGPTFGTISSTYNTARQLQLVAKFVF